MAFVPATAAVLDVGCGYGRILAELSVRGYDRLTGIDFSENLIRRGARLYPHLDLRVQEEADVAFPAGSMDAVILFGVLTCIARDEEQAFLIAEIERVLKPGGIVHVSDFLLNPDARNMARYEKNEDSSLAYGCFTLEDGALLRHHDPEYIARLLHPFQTELYETTTYVTMNGNSSNGFSFYGRKVPA